MALILFLSVSQVQTCKVHLDEIMAQYKLHKATGQIVLDSSGNGYTAVNGNSLAEDSEDVLWTDRGAYFYSGTGIYVAPPEISETGLILSRSFSLLIWAYPDDNTNFALAEKNDHIEYGYITNQMWGQYLNIDCYRLYVDAYNKWSLYSYIFSYTDSEQILKLMYNYSATELVAYNIPWTDSPSNLFVIGASESPLNFSGFIYDVTFYDEYIYNTEFAAGNLFNFGSNCNGFPLYESACLLICEDPEKDSACEECSCSSSSCNQTGQCIQCDASCSNYCNGLTSSDCLNVPDFCLPRPYDPYALSCNWNVTCVDDCYYCEVDMQCTTCNIGFYLQVDKTCDTSCAAGTYMDGLSCFYCHSDCAECTGALNSECTSCADSNATLNAGSCICSTGYYYDGSTCSACATECAECSGGTSTDCTACSDPNSYPNGGRCDCNSGFYKNGSICSACNIECEECSGGSNSDCIACSDANSTLTSGSCQCNLGFFKNGSVCSACDTECEECSGGSNSDCVACSDTNSTLTSGSCQCNPGFFKNGSTCSACDTECTECSGGSNTDCTVCSDPNSYSSGGRCDCNPGFFKNGSICSACDTECTECSGGSSTDCTACSDANSTLNNGSCECNAGFYRYEESCELCHESCKECDGGSRENCLSCSDDGFLMQGTCEYCTFANSIFEEGECVCKNGYYKSSENPLACKKCHDDCIECEGPLSSDCGDCTDPNSYKLNGSCMCSEGFYTESTNPITCSKCNEMCSTCDGPNTCLTCSDPSLVNTNGFCLCEEGFYLEGTCKACGNDCKRCTDANNCLSCIDQNKTSVNGLCICKENLCLKDGICEECEEEKRNSQGILGAVALGISIGLNLLSMFTLDDPTVLWTVASIAQFISYLPILDIPYTESLKQFLLSYQTMIFLPNVFLSLIPESDLKSPEEYQNFGKLVDEYQDTQLIRNTGRPIILIGTVAATYLLLYMASFVVFRVKIRSKIRSFVSTMLKFWLQLYLDFLIASTLLVFWNIQDNKFGFFVLDLVVVLMCMVTPPVLFIMVNFKERYILKDEKVVKLIGSVFDGLNLDRKLPSFNQFILSCRKVLYAVCLYWLREFPLVFLGLHIHLSMVFLTYLVLFRVYKKKINLIINVAGEGVLLLTFVGLVLCKIFDPVTELEYFINGINTFFIIGASVFNTIAGCVEKCRNRRKTARVATNIFFIKNECNNRNSENSPEIFNPLPIPQHQSPGDDPTEIIMKTI